MDAKFVRAQPHKAAEKAHLHRRCLGQLRYDGQRLALGAWPRCLAYRVRCPTATAGHVLGAEGSVLKTVLHLCNVPRASSSRKAFWPPRRSRIGVHATRQEALAP